MSLPSRRAALGGLLLALVLAATALQRWDRLRRPRARDAAQTSLDESLEPLRREFNRHRDRPRLLAVLAPSCRVCILGALAVRDELLADPELPIAVELVWIEVLPADVGGKPDKRIALFGGDPRVRHFYDGRQRLGRRLAERLDWPAEGPLFDAYLYFGPGAEWRETLPEPALWFHQQLEVGGPHLRAGEDLRPALGELARRAAAAAPAGPPGGAASASDGAPSG